MPKNHVKFHSVEGKRLILIVDVLIVKKDISAAGLYQTIHMLYQRGFS